ncbi:ABC-type transport auxiliary lipoprotein family protein [Nitratidesulfovibrio sp. 1201_IL3209]|uniref:ABC-type transport auxiliary lipoprotein family protein n=1 Tax=Nitratidesulfovibrio sp. 1201_IL3209 TaxID=3084053 RepID=UPI002FD8B1E4
MPATHTRAFDPYAFAPYAFNRRAPLSARRGLLLSLSLACLLLAALSGCARVLDPGPAPTHLLLAPAMPAPGAPGAPGAGGALPLQLAVSLPETSRMLDTDRIALVLGGVTGREVRYYAGAKWTSPAPRLVQRLLVEAFERNGRLDGAAEESAGIYPDYRLMSDLRRFNTRMVGGASAPTVEVELALRLVDLKTGRIVAFTAIGRDCPAAGSGLPQVAEAFETAMGDVLARATAWSLDAMAATRS